ATIEVLSTGHETASVVGEALIEVNCFGIVCTYKGEELEATATGPLLSAVENPNGEVNLNEQEARGSGSFCPSRAKLDIKTTPLSATYIGSGGSLSSSTSLSTSLKGGGKEGAEITVAEGSKVKDTATLSGENASKAGGTVDYAVYKDKECK